MRKKSIAAVVGGASLSDEGNAAYDRGDFDEALRLLRPLADQGDYPAQLTLAMMYYDGEGVPQDHAEAARWLRLAADSNPDDGFVRGMLGNIEETEKHRRRAYDGDPEGQYRLGTSYRAGWGVPADLVQAHMWMTLAAERGYERAVSLRDIFARQLTPEQLAESERLVQQWRRRPSPVARGISS
jgi:TPR repeat protein